MALSPKVVSFADTQVRYGSPYQKRSEGNSMLNANGSAPAAAGTADKMNKTAPTKKKRERYSPGDKAMILAECAKKPVKAVAREWGIGPSIIYRWRDKLRHHRRSTNGIRPSRRFVAQPPAVTVDARGGLDATQAALLRVQAEVKTALDQVNAMRAALKLVFGSDRG